MIFFGIGIGVVSDGGFFVDSIKKEKGFRMILDLSSACNRGVRLRIMSNSLRGVMCGFSCFFDDVEADDEAALNLMGFGVFYGFEVYLADVHAFVVGDDPV